MTLRMTDGLFKLSCHAAGVLDAPVSGATGHDLTGGLGCALLPTARTIVYICATEDGTISYVGKTERGIRRRLAEHLNGRRERAGLWTRVWVIEVPGSRLERAEGAVSRICRPRDQVRAPAA